MIFAKQKSSFLVTLATNVHRINSTLSNTPTTYIPNISKQHNRFSGSISPKMDHRFRVENQLRSHALKTRLRDESLSHGSIECRHLVSVVFGDHSNITKLGAGAFHHYLTSITLPDKLTVLKRCDVQRMLKREPCSANATPSNASSATNT